MELAMFQQRRGVFTIVLVAVFVLAVASSFIYLKYSGKLAEYKINMFSSIGTDNLSFNEDEQAVEKEGALSIGAVNNGAEEITSQGSSNSAPLIVSAGKKYEETAEKGNGITHLARRALRKYLGGSSVNLSAEQKMFCEDYIQKHIGEGGLKTGESIVVSEDLIAEAVNQSLKLSPSQLENLKNFTELVWDSSF